MSDRTVTESFRVIGADGHVVGDPAFPQPDRAKWPALLEHTTRVWPEHAPYRIQRMETVVERTPWVDVSTEGDSDV